jgi:hypothetical protein
MFAQIVSVDRMRRFKATKIKRNADAIEMAEGKLVDTGKVRKIVEWRIDVRARMCHERTALYGSAVHDCQLLILDRVRTLPRKLRRVIVMRLCEVVDHEARYSPRRAQRPVV